MLRPGVLLIWKATVTTESGAQESSTICLTAWKLSPVFLDLIDEQTIEKKLPKKGKVYLALTHTSLPYLV